MGKRKVTMEDIASHLGISKNSVSVALNGKMGVSDELRKSILQTASQLQYGMYAHQRADSDCRHIVIIISENFEQDSFFYNELIWAIEKEAQLQNCIPVKHIVSHQAMTEREPPIFMVPTDSCRFLVVGILPDDYMRMLVDIGQPIISVDIQYPRLNIGYVGASNFEGGVLATEYLISQNHKKIGFIGPIFAAQSVYHRWCGFQQTLTMHGLDINEKHCIVGDKNEPELFKTLELFNTLRTIEGCLDQLEDMPTAWFCAGDRIAVAMINYCSKKGIGVPKDVSIMGFDDITIAQMTFPQLTTVRVDRKAMGMVAVNYLLGNHSLSMADMNISLSAQLTIRDSVGRVG